MIIFSSLRVHILSTGKALELTLSHASIETKFSEQLNVVVFIIISSSSSSSSRSEMELLDGRF